MTTTLDCEAAVPTGTTSTHPAFVLGVLGEVTP